MAKIRVVKALLDVSGVRSDLRPVFRAAVDRLVKVLESSHYDEAWEQLHKTSNKWEGELNSKYKKLKASEVALLLFSRSLVETRDDGVKVYTIKLDVNTYYSIKSVIGYGVAGNDEIYVNTKYAGVYTVDDMKDLKAISSNLGHEEGHNCGMDHDFNSTARRKHSLAYLTNDAIEIAWDVVFKKGYVEADKTIMNTPDPKPTTPVVEEPIKDPTIPPEVIVNPAPVTKVRVCWKPWYGFGLITLCENRDV